MQNKQISFRDLVEKIISEILLPMDGDDLEKIANVILTKRHKYIGEQMFEILDEDN